MRACRTEYDTHCVTGLSYRIWHTLSYRYACLSYRIWHLVLQVCMPVLPNMTHILLHVSCLNMTHIALQVCMSAVPNYDTHSVLYRNMTHYSITGMHVCRAEVIFKKKCCSPPPPRPSSLALLLLTIFEHLLMNLALIFCTYSLSVSPLLTLSVTGSCFSGGGRRE